MAWTDRLAELGIRLPDVAPPAGAYVPAVRSGSLVYTAGQVPFVDGKIAATGKVGAEISADEAKGHARTCALNALAGAITFTVLALLCLLVVTVFPAWLSWSIVVAVGTTVSVMLLAS